MKHYTRPMTRQGGFTLTELMIVVAIVGIIASLAYPSYQSTIVSTARLAAQADLMALASAMERHNATNFSYKGAAVSGADIGVPTIFASHSPASEPMANKKYDLAIASVGNGGQSYVITATPVTGGIVEGNGALYYYSDGRKAWDQNTNGSVDVNEYCWSC